MEMYCPYCGNAMHSTLEGWYCSTGNMYVSPKLAEILLSLLEDTFIAPQTAVPWQDAKHSSFRCPRCRQQMVSDTRGLKQRCMACGLDLPPRVVYQLVEFHPHLSSQESSSS